MQDATESARSARAVQISGAGPSLLPYLSWLLLSVVVGVALAAPLLLLAQDGRDDVSLVAALWQPERRPLAIGALVAVSLTVVVLIGFMRALPRALTRHEIVVDDGGLEIAARPKWWYRGKAAHIGWDDVQVVSAESIGLPDGSDTGRLARRALHFYLHRVIPGLPAFAGLEAVDEADVHIEGVRVPSYRLRIGDLTPYAHDEVHQLATAIDAVRPDLFYTGTRAAQWYTPTEHLAPGARLWRSASPSAPSPHPSDSPGPGLDGRVPDIQRPAGAVWLNYGHPHWEIAGGVVVLAGVLAGSIYLVNNPFGWDNVPAALLALVVIVPLFFCCLVLPAVLWLYPRLTAAVGIRVAFDGLVIVRKRRWRWAATVSTTVPWNQIQAIVTRGGRTATDPVGAKQRFVDLYLHPGLDEAYDVPGVGLDLTVSQPREPDSAGTAQLVTFPAVRVRLPYRHDREAAGRQRWEEAVRRGPETLTSPRHQLRPALLAFRPQLCHGFEDLWSGLPR
ncbi:cytochrome d ubiquinol oxidase subunit II [Phytoactinopolyspora mesophila]|uniref:Uncharacterized protein n=1 Tax=Phytoactinopolyspora mesophila TaxID=2650750 RepID=A0A7K3M4L6_9ACTN|nr:cytochrome d ubiquinol oxidase subunit II [Phytoactinopolyspora mesophila]NDL57368.1 hypothetical protein [Phytoactinopolyspora mesophila]